jgi:hypothetical protein
MQNVVCQPMPVVASVLHGRPPKYYPQGYRSSGPKARRSGLHSTDRHAQVAIAALRYLAKDLRLRHKVVAIALANWLARIAWSVLGYGRNFEATTVQAAAVNA